MRIPPSLFDVLTGLSDALRGETRSYENGVLVASSRESFDDAATNAVVVSWAADGGVSTNVLRFGRTLETVSPEGRTLVFHDSYGYPYLTQRSSPTGTSLDYATYAYRNLLGDLLEDGEYTLKTGSSTSSHWKYRHQGYDARGNPAASTNELGETVLRSYDARRNLVGELGDTYPVRYGCDSAGRRIRMETTRDGGTTWDETRWTYDPATGNLLSKIYVDGSVETHTYTADGLPLRTTFPGGRWVENRYDGNRRLAGVSSDDPSCEAEYAYDAFGETLSASGPLADAFNIRYSTKYYDAESDLYYYGYRYYAPSLHRWLTRDPIAEEGGVNLYGFCENASVFKYDSDGLLSYVIDVGVSKFSGDVFLDQSQEKFEDQFALLKQVLDSVYKIPDQAFDNSREKGRVKFNGTQFTGTRLEFASKIKRELTSQWLFANSAGYKTTMRKLRDLKEKAIAEYDVVALLVHGRISEIDGEYVVQSNFNGERKPTLSVRGIIDKKI